MSSNLFTTVRSSIDTKKTIRTVTFFNLYSYYVARKSSTDYSKFDKIYFDGILMSVLMSVLCLRKIERKSFDMTSLAPRVFTELNEHNGKLTVIGSSKENLYKFLDYIVENYPNIQISYFRSGYFDNNRERTESILNAKASGADVLLVGMGALHQDQYILDYKSYEGAGIAYSCGGFIHQTATKGVSYYPKIFDKLNIRWLYRIIDEPPLLKRYFIFYPISLFFLLFDFIKDLRGRINE